jgi:hypothetical protein
MPQPQKGQTMRRTICLLLSGGLLTASVGTAGLPMVEPNSRARMPITIVPPPPRPRSASCATKEPMSVANTMSTTPMLYRSEAVHGGNKNSARVGTNINVSSAQKATRVCGRCLGKRGRRGTPGVLTSLAPVRFGRSGVGASRSAALVDLKTAIARCWNIGGNNPNIARALLAEERASIQS